MTREERIQSLAARAGYRCVDDLKNDIRESRKAFFALQLKQFNAASKAAHPYAAKNRGARADTAPQKIGCAASDAGHGARGDPATAVFAWCAWWRAPLTLCYPSMQQPARKFYRK